TGKLIVNPQRRAADRTQVLPTATTIMGVVRAALGDKASGSSVQFAMASLSATSLDVVGQYAASQDAAADSRFDEARQHALKAVELDPSFGVGYQLLAIASRNLGRTPDAVAYIKQALDHLEGMTERERYATRAFYFRVTLDYSQCVEQYGELIKRFASD